MTDAELDRLAELWEYGFTMYELSIMMNYSKSYINEIMIRRRELFPYKEPRITNEERRRWARLVIDGDLSLEDAAYRLHVLPSTIEGWVKRVRNGRL